MLWYSSPTSTFQNPSAYFAFLLFMSVMAATQTSLSRLFGSYTPSYDFNIVMITHYLLLPLGLVTTSTSETYLRLTYCQELSMGFSGTCVFTLFMVYWAVCQTYCALCYPLVIFWVPNQAQSHPSSPWPIYMKCLATRRDTVSSQYFQWIRRIQFSIAPVHCMIIPYWRSTPYLVLL